MPRHQTLTKANLCRGDLYFAGLHCLIDSLNRCFDNSCRASSVEGYNFETDDDDSMYGSFNATKKLIISNRISLQIISFFTVTMLIMIFQ